MSDKELTEGQKAYRDGEKHNDSWSDEKTRDYAKEYELDEMEDSK